MAKIQFLIEKIWLIQNVLFQDLLKSISYSPNTSFSIMTSKEQEYEARAQALKRLTFVVFGSQLDQYHGQMNDIQGTVVFAVRPK